MRLAANLSWMYRTFDWAQRFDAAAQDGFAGVEILLPYEQAPAWYATQLREAGLQLALINTPIDADAAGPGRLGWAAVPGAETEFRQAFDQARAVAQTTGCRHIHVMAGHVAGLPSQACSDTLYGNLTVALTLAEQDDLILTLEALNRADMPGYHYHLPEQVVAVLSHFDTPRLRMQFDFYHCLKEALDLPATLSTCAPWIGHVQIAGAEGRHEPDLGRDGLLEAVCRLPALGHHGWLGCEYAPRGSAREGLAWALPLRARGVLA